MSIFQVQQRQNNMFSTTNPPAGDGTSGTTNPTDPVDPKKGFISRMTNIPFLTQTDLVSGVAAGALGMFSGQNEMNSLKTAGIQVGSSLIGRSISEVLPDAVSNFKPLVGFAISNAILNSTFGRKKGLLQKVAVGTSIDLGSSAFMQTEKSVFQTPMK
jgi:hypothetical protein